MKVGLDIGSTTIKCVVLDENDELIWDAYERHFSQIAPKAVALLQQVYQKFSVDNPIPIAVSGSAGMGLAEDCGLPFIQEVYATRVAALRRNPETDAIIELGGEDAKILFLSDQMEVRMNGSCAGGTGAFIDQMATLLSVTPSEMNELALKKERLYTIASRCGVFAKSDVQPLLNQGAKKTDLAASIFYAVVNQTIAGLAQGRKIGGNVLYLGGPLTFLSALRDSFDDVLKIKGTCPKDSLYYVAIGAALHSDELFALPDVIEKLQHYTAKAGGYRSLQPLFSSAEEYSEFTARHKKAQVPTTDPASYSGDVYLGIDAGSTTVKFAVIDREGRLLCSDYRSNSGNPIPHTKAFLEDFYRQFPNLHICGSTATGYGEDLIRNAFGVDGGIVETMAHFLAAKTFIPDVDFIIDIGGQDMKCFKIRNGAIDNIFLNEACSSGCGSFLQTFAGALGYSIGEFATLGLFADGPVDLGSRCTVFMNSSVKQAQKDGASIENISAGLSISVVKNALYKVIRAVSAESLGKHIVVQGGTFLNDAVLRAFEKELDIHVVRPNIAGLMGAYGAALYAKEHRPAQTTLVNAEQLETFEHKVRTVTCGGCTNNCRLTVNDFGEGRRYISGNRCERPITKKASDNHLNLVAYKQEKLAEFGERTGSRPTVGFPMGLNFYELLPFWHTLFTKLDFGIALSPPSNRELYINGQASIPSDTVCFPAKLMHGHVQALLDRKIPYIFYPCMSYNVDEHAGDNHYNCPVVAYYPEVIDANMNKGSTVLIHDYLGIHRPKDLPKHLTKVLSEQICPVSLREVKAAVKAAYEAYHAYLEDIRAKGEEIIREARRDGHPIIVLAGRPYHIDPEINHGIDKLIAEFGAAVVTEDVVSGKTGKVPVHVLNQWTYHARLYSAADYVATQPDMELVQLVSFGCGVDAITTDEVRDILESRDRIYTQIKIDEITNLGAVRIRLRSLFAASEAQKRGNVK